MSSKKKVTPGRILGLAVVAGIVGLFFLIRKKADEDNYHPVAAQVDDENKNDAKD